MTIEHEQPPTVPTGSAPMSSAGMTDMRQPPSTGQGQSSGVTGAAAEGSREVMGEVKDQVSVMAGDAREQITNLMDRAKEELRSQGESRGQQLTTGLQTLSNQMSAMMQGRPEEAGWVGTAFSDMQQRIQRYARSLQDRGPRALVDDTAMFARRRPGTFLLAASVTGFAVGRLVRSGAAASSNGSSHSNYTSTGSNYSTGSSAMYAPGMSTIPLDDGLPPTYVDQPGGLP